MALLYLLLDTMLAAAMARESTARSRGRPHQETLSGSDDDDTSFVEEAARVETVDSKLDLAFIAHEWLRYGPKRGAGHRNLDLARLAYCFVEFFAERVVTPRDFKHIFLDREKFDVDEVLKESVRSSSCSVMLI